MVEVVVVIDDVVGEFVVDIEGFGLLFLVFFFLVVCI